MAEILLSNSFSLYMDSQLFNLSEVNAVLPKFCVVECLEPLMTYYNCLGQNSTADLLDNAFCGVHNNENCLVLLASGITNSRIVSNTECTCPEDLNCAQTLQEVTVYLGCCAASWFDNKESPSSVQITPQQFESCQVPLAPMCTGVISDKAVSGYEFTSVHLGVALVLALTAVGIA